MTTSDRKDTENVRSLAADILRKVDTRKAYADVLLDNTLKSRSFSPRDRALLTELLYGTLRWRGRLDRQLGEYISRPLKETEPFIRNLLRLTLYQLLFLHKIPAYAAVNDAVDLAKAYAGRKAGGFVNGVLRAYLREKRELRKPGPKQSSTSDLAEYWSHPEWLVKQWLEYFGAEQVEALMEANNDPAPLTLRANLTRATRETLLSLLRSAGVEASPTRWSPQGITVQPGFPVRELPGFQEGRFQVQGEASQLVSYLVAPKPGERILDACAAPGGKTTHMAELMNDAGEIIAADISAKSLKKMAANVERLGLKSIRTFQADLTEQLFEPFNRPYGRILVDAPCSGLGTLRSHPETKWNRGKSAIKRLSQLQKRILVQTAGYVRPGGVLVYSTCTLSKEENENVVESFLADHKEFVLNGAAGYLPETAREMVRGSYFLSLPHLHNTDGFFAARMTRLDR
ncbi:MAG: 16S rRNA (cytosine(967)-C(5))-methyltransferase RsmB [Candidatus Binatia bacterium]